jgi:L-amino acid N-acyltransferase YncA
MGETTCFATRNATFETEVPGLATLATEWLDGHRWVAESDVDGAAGDQTLAVRSRIAQLDGIWRDTVFMERRRAED